MIFPLESSLIFVGGFLGATAVRASTITARDGPSPLLPYDAEASRYCSWWLDLNTPTACSSILSDNFITLEDFRRWNPSITAECGNLVVGRSYCVETMGEPAPVPTLPVQTSTTTPTAKPTIPSISLSTTSTSSQMSSTTFSKSTTTATTTKPGNGVATPQPTQPGMVTNCARFHWIAKGVTCSQVISYQKITLTDFVTWNPTVLNDCSGMWAEVNVCVGIIGSSPTSTRPTTTTNTPGNGIATPQPTQPGMATNCAKFHWVAPGVVCSQITSYQKISLADFVKWNPTVGSDCGSMQANVNVCVGLIGGSPTSTKPTATTSAGNGIQTPQPTQPGMVMNCKKFHFAAEGVVCSQITSYQKISLSDFLKWNMGIGADCKNMWAGTWTCVGV